MDKNITNAVSTESKTINKDEMKELQKNKKIGFIVGIIGLVLLPVYGLGILLLLLAVWFWNGKKIPKIVKSVTDFSKDSKQEKIFWDLMNGKYGHTDLGVGDIIMLYIISLVRELRVGDFPIKSATDQNSFNKNIIQESNGSFKNIQILCDAMEEKKKISKELFNKITFISTDAEALKKFEDFKNDMMNRNIEGIDKVLSSIIDAAKDPKNETTVLEAMNKFGEDGIYDPLYKKIQEKETAKKLKETLNDWEYLNMLRWCIASFKARS